MTAENNIRRCTKCNCTLIAEESETHTCFKPNSVWVIDGVVWIGDRHRYYKWKTISDEKLQQDNSRSSDKDDTEPFFWFETSSADMT
jgi:hypothetical protein